MAKVATEKRIRVRMLHAVGGPHYCYQVDDEAEFKLTAAGRLIKLGYAQALDPAEGESAVLAAIKDGKSLGIVGKNFGSNGDPDYEHD